MLSVGVSLLYTWQIGIIKLIKNQNYVGETGPWNKWQKKSIFYAVNRRGRLKYETYSMK